jgi:hypothetical protein
VQINHLEHHQHCLREDDVEGASARASRRWIIAEMIVTAALVTLAVVIPTAWVRYHVLTMVVGQCLTSFFAVWTVHHDCEQPGPFARTLRGLLKNGATYNMFFHVEHHLFPAVPTCHLPQLAKRLDQAAPELTRLRVF